MAIKPRIIKRLSGNNTPIVMEFPVAASQTIQEGDLIIASSGKAAVAVAATAALIGVALHDITTTASPSATDLLKVELLRNGVLRIPYTGSSKTTLAQSDCMGTKFDLSDKKTMNLDDTTGGMCIVVAFNNTDQTADVVIAPANLAL